MMMMHQFDEYQMHDNLNEANDNLFLKQSNDSGLNSSVSGLSTVNEEDDDLTTNPSGVKIPKINIQRGSISSLGSNASMTSDDIEFQKREEERIKEMYKVLNIERRKSVAKTKSDGLDIARDYVRRASTIQGLAAPGGSGGDKSRGNSRRGSMLPNATGGLSPNDNAQGRRGSIMPGGQRRPSTIFMPPTAGKREKQPSVF